jgi:hypothetical protein
MLTALGFIAGLTFTCADVGALAFPDREMPPEEEEGRWEPTIDELYSDGGGDA